MYIGYPLFPGKTEAEQVSLIFDICGTPETENWPEGTELRGYKEMRPRIAKQRSLRAHVQ